MTTPRSLGVRTRSDGSAALTIDGAEIPDSEPVTIAAGRIAAFAWGAVQAIEAEAEASVAKAEQATKAAEARTATKIVERTIEQPAPPAARPPRLIRTTITDTSGERIVLAREYEPEP